MVCPRCHNAGFEVTDDVSAPLIVRGKESFDKFNIRRIICLQCGFYFKTEEKFTEEIEVKGIKIMGLVEDYQNKIKKRGMSTAARVNKGLFDED